MEIKETKIIKITPANKEETIAQAASIIKAGGLVVFPTETVYGLGANVFDEDALKKIFLAKGRPSDNPLIVHVCDLDQLAELAESISPMQQKLIDNFWPGPLTILFQKKETVSKIASGGFETIAIRMPAHPVAKALIQASGVPIAAPSANISGRPSGTTGEDVYRDLSGKVDMIIDADQSDIGLESTVVKVKDNRILILRPGAVTKEMLENFSNEVLFAKNEKDLESSPGTRYKHYAPKAKLEIFASDEDLERRRNELVQKGTKVGLLPKRSLKETSKNLYSDLRNLDREGVDVILCLSVAEEGLGLAIMDRLNRASSN